MHGGAGANAKAKQARLRAEAEAQREMDKIAKLRTLGDQIDVSPSEALLNEVRWTAGHVDWLRGKVQELELRTDSGSLTTTAGQPTDPQHELVWGVTETKEIGSSQYPGTDETWTAGENIWYTLYMKERQHLVAVSTAALRAGVEERRVQLAEDQGALVSSVIRHILGDLELTPAQEARSGEIVVRHLRLLKGGAA
jgi:hypothetical protein